MKFGHVETSELDQLDLSLPADHPGNGPFLAGGRVKDPGVYVGCAKWGRDEWVGLIYPKGTKSGNYLENYVNHFNGIELNGTFYQLRRSNVESWAAVPTDTFKYCPKFSRRISHIKRLKEVEENTAYFMDAMGLFGGTLGLPFLQMPDNFAPKFADRLYDYLDALPDSPPIALELRHTDWFNDPEVAAQLYANLEKNNVTLIITDTAGRRDCVHQRLTSRKAFVRFIGYDLHETDYQRMDEWADRIRTWLDGGIEEVYFFLHQENEKNTVVNAAYMARKLNEVCGLQIKEPEFITDPAP